MAVSYQLLETLCASHAPVIVSEPAMVDVLRSYVSAGLVEATIPPAVNARGTSFKQAGTESLAAVEGMSAIVTGGDSGIGRAVAVLFAREGADVAVVYLSEKVDAEATKVAVEAEVGSSRVDLQACKLEYSIVSPK